MYNHRPQVSAWSYALPLQVQIQAQTRRLVIRLRGRSGGTGVIGMLNNVRYMIPTKQQRTREKRGKTKERYTVCRHGLPAREVQDIYGLA